MKGNIHKTGHASFVITTHVSNWVCVIQTFHHPMFKMNTSGVSISKSKSKIKTGIKRSNNNNNNNSIINIAAASVEA